MSQRNFRNCNSCDTFPSSKSRGVQCYDERKLLHVIIDLEMGTPVEIILKHNTKTELTGYYLRYNKHQCTIHFQPFGEPEVLEISLSEICIIRYSL